MASGRIGGRGARQRVRTARRRKVGSTRWLERQLNDPHVREARRLGYRSRAAFKLIEIDDRFTLLRPGARVLDLGAAPGGWVQVAVERVRPGKTGGRVVGLDMAPVEAVAGAIIVEGDVMAEDTPARLAAALGAPADVVLSDMAAATTGHAVTDHLRTLALAEAALDIACALLAPGGAVVLKLLQGAGEAELFRALGRAFATARRVKPKASRAGSAELYLVATGFRGASA